MRRCFSLLPLVLTEAQVADVARGNAFRGDGRASGHARDGHLRAGVRVEGTLGIGPTESCVVG